MPPETENVAQERRRGRGKASAANESAARSLAVVRCPFCHDDVPQDALAAKCGACATVHHATCFDEQKGCSIAGCTGKVAHLVKGWRAALGECRACSARVYLDENVALCRSCEAHHHTACFEARAGCAECGSGEGLILSAGAFARTTARWGAAANVLYATAALALFALASLSLALKALAPAVVSLVVLILSFVLARSLRSLGLRRAMAAAQAVRPTTVLPAAKASPSEPPREI